MEFEAPGLQGEWLNGWLAAIGVAVLLPDVRLSFRRGTSPLAVFESEKPGLAGRLADCLGDVEALNRVAIARFHPDTEVELPRTVSSECFAARATLARRQRDRTLEMTVTDLWPTLGTQKESGPTHGPFDPSAPKGLTIHQRAVAAAEWLTATEAPVDFITRTLAGKGVRTGLNGLGFDYRRVAGSSHPDSGVTAEPVVELLCFFGLRLFPVRGDGYRTLQRGWTARQSKRGAFSWPLWTASLDVWAIDALLDRFFAMPTDRRERELPRLGIHAVYGSVYLEPKGSSDMTRGYAGERIWPTTPSSRSLR